jgi:CRP-like cAMP-binding protein
LLQPGDFFGYMALLDDEFHLITAEALEDCEVTIFPPEDFYKLLTHPQVMQQFVRMLAGNIQSEQDKLMALAYSSVRKRTAEALLELRARDIMTSRPRNLSLWLLREKIWLIWSERQRNPSFGRLVIFEVKILSRSMGLLSQS